jgi:O-antigen ligase
VRRTPSHAFILLTLLLAVLWFAGGASRADALAQVVTRGAAWALVIVAILFLPAPRLRPIAPIAIFVAAATVLVALQLIPLPPSLWLALPGREVLAQSAVIAGQEQPWRPLSFSPGATVNALSSMIVPIVSLLLISALPQTDRGRLVAVLLALVTASCVVGLLQLSGGDFDHPLINDRAGEVSGMFSNRNHFALFASFGFLLAPAWAFGSDNRPAWLGLMILPLLLLILLIVLATGSRMGAVVGVLALVLGLLTVRRKVVARLRRLPTKVTLLAALGTIVLFVTIVALSVSRGRAISLNRALSLDVGDDLRGRTVSTVLEMVGRYFPFGSGYGAFDPVYRITEPGALLSQFYFNRAHNDLMEVVLDGGVFGLLLLVAALVWWLLRSVSAWRGAEGSGTILQRLGSGIIFLTLLSSVTDYPARTPMIMAVLVIAAVWLGEAGEQRRSGSRRSGSSAEPLDQDMRPSARNRATVS